MSSSPEYQQGVTIGNAVMGRWEKILSSSFTSMLLYTVLYTCSGVRKKKNPPTRMTDNHYTALDNCTLLVVSS